MLVRPSINYYRSEYLADTQASQDLRIQRIRRKTASHVKNSPVQSPYKLVQWHNMKRGN